MEEVGVSIVSHGHGALVHDLLRDLDAQCRSTRLSVVLTLNIDEPRLFAESDFGFPLVIIRNRQPRGFSANHNAACRLIQAPYFCVLNPDIRVGENPFPALIAGLSAAGVAGPLVLAPGGSVEDSARKFPTPMRILRRALSAKRRADYAADAGTVFPDWVAGMFMLFRMGVFRSVGGFDERYFLYYEDADICRRLRRQGQQVAWVPAARVVHHARRHSHRKVRFMIWHLTSMLRFFKGPD